MAKSFAQRLLSSMKDVLEGTLELLGDPDACAGAGLNPDATADSTTARAARAALDRVSTYFNSDNPDGAKYLQVVDDIIAVRDALLDLISAIRFSGDATPVAEYLQLRLVALIKDAENIARYLRHLGLPTDVPPLAPARGPPFWQSTILRRRYGQPSDASDA